MKRLLCYLGIHKWVYMSKTIVKCNKVCLRCNKWKHSVYDMTFGDTIWIDGKYWK